MKQRRNRQSHYDSLKEEDIRRFGKFLILPVVVILLMIIILVVDRAKQPHPQETASAEETAPIETEAPADMPDETQEEAFLVGGTPEVQALINQYFTAKQNADPEAIYQMFGWTDLTGIEDLRRQLQYDARYTEGYRNITCYTRPGLSEGSYLTYVTYDLKFKDSLTLAPGILWNYIVMGEDGNYYLTDASSLDEAVQSYIREAEASDEITLLKTQIYANLRQALENDPSLAESYSIIERQGGSAGALQEETTAQNEVTIQIGQ